MAFRGSAVAASSSSTQTVTVSGISIQLNDIVLLCLADFIGNTPSFPSGFAVVPGTTGLNDGNVAILTYYKVATGSEPSTYSVTGVSFGGALNCRVYSGRLTSGTIFTTTAQTAAGSPGAFPISFAATGVTATASDDAVIFLGEAPTGSSTACTASYTASSGWTNGALANDTVDNFASTEWLASSDLINTSGATGTIGGSLSITSGAGPGNSTYMAQVVSIATAAAVIPVPSRGPMPKQIYIMP